MKTIRLLILLLTASIYSYAQNSDINNFIVKESLLKNSKLAIIAADSLNNPIEKINGLYRFSVSGFTQEVKFSDGVAVLPLPLESSAFVYIKHENNQGTHSKLFYVYKKDGNLTPYAFNSLWLVLFPVILFVIAFLFRKFLIVAVILFLIFIYFNHSNGLSVGTFFETIFDGLKSAF
ncbi:MAG: hypothetical protein H7223_02250 [Pedobacter sp.]|nr:hypothetical protein [Pedobacter sp.]